MKDTTGMDFTDIFSCMWNVVITLTTCGYGDIFPVTFFGRIVGGLITFWGTFIASMVVVVVTEQIDLDPAEISTFKMCRILLLKTKLKDMATTVLQKAYLISRALKVVPLNQHKVNLARNQYRQANYKFKN